MKLGLYGLKDKVMACFTTLVLARTNEEAVRKSVMSIIGTKPLRDVEIYKVGEADETNGEIKGFEKSEFEKVEWDIYKLPENKAEDLGVLNAKGDLQ